MNTFCAGVGVGLGNKTEIRRTKHSSVVPLYVVRHEAFIHWQKPITYRHLLRTTTPRQAARESAADDAAA